jgi:hypothetical protein
MPRVPTVRKADLDRVLKALKDNGQAAVRVEMLGNAVTIFPGSLTGDAPSPHLSELDAWREKRRGGRAT